MRPPSHHASFRWNSLTLIVPGVIAPGLIMASDCHWGLAVPIGVLGCCLAIIGIFDFLRTFDATSGQPSAHTSISLTAVVPQAVELIASALIFFAALRFAVAGTLPRPALSAGVFVTLSFIALVAGAYRFCQALVGNLAARPWKQAGFWLCLINAMIYLPALGAFSLFDPWETHYGEVAREMLARDDWISLWWAHEGWFLSKPVLDFWLQALAFSLSGVRYLPDQMLQAAPLGSLPAPEWAARLPIFLLAFIATYLLYRAVARGFGKRAGFLAALGLTTMPYWYLIAHQSMTDMPYAAPLTAALSLIALGLQTDPTEQCLEYEIKLRNRNLRFSAFHAVFGLILLSALPQILYLITRNITLHWATSPHGFHWHLDEFSSGSGGGNCGLPGNEECKTATPVIAIMQPALMALFWIFAAGSALWASRYERRKTRLYFIAAWYFTALSALAKGAPGLVLPLATTAAALIAARRYRDFEQLELGNLVLILACVCFPWYVQMYARHGTVFTDRLLFYDMYKRAFVHVHDTNAGDDTSFRYYIWQLGYGLLPWTGLSALGLFWGIGHKQEDGSTHGPLLSFFVLWCALGFGMFTITLTKFHHYVLPLVPALAALTGIFLNHLLEEQDPKQYPQNAAYFMALSLSAGLSVYGLMRCLPGSVSGWLVGATPPAASIWQAASALVSAALLTGLALRNTPLPKTTATPSLAGLAAGLTAIPVFLAGRDLLVSNGNEATGQARLLHLFSYQYTRPWPKTLDFTAILSAFVMVASVALLGLGIKRLRYPALVFCSALACLWSAWSVNVYLVRTAPHWGQRDTVLAYYQHRKSAEEILVAYQMNWKGENFYTGNHLATFVASGEKFKTWLAAEKAKGHSAIYIMSEHSRVDTLKSELGSVHTFQLITTPELNNKFVLARVEL